MDAPKLATSIKESTILYDKCDINIDIVMNQESISLFPVFLLEYASGKEKRRHALGIHTRKWNRSL
jgi:hypothetical protein